MYLFEIIKKNIHIFLIIIISLFLIWICFSYNSNSVRKSINMNIFTVSLPIVSIILPVTSNGNNLNENNTNPSHLLLMKYFYPSFLSTIEPSKFIYRVYLGYAYDDPYFSNSTFLAELKKQMNKINVVYVVHIFVRLVDMYNILAKKAYDDGSDYFITLNDDTILQTKNWTSAMVNILQNNPILSDFGTTGFVGTNNLQLLQFNFISRKHFDIFNQTFYTPVMSNWGIDNWICDMYYTFNSCYINTNLTMVNHVDIPKERYEIDRQFKEKLYSEIKHYVSIVRKHFDENRIKYDIQAVNKILSK